MQEKQSPMSDKETTKPTGIVKSPQKRRLGSKLVVTLLLSAIMATSAVTFTACNKKPDENVDPPYEEIIPNPEPTPTPEPTPDPTPEPEPTPEPQPPNYDDIQCTEDLTDDQLQQVIDVLQPIAQAGADEWMGDNAEKCEVLMLDINTFERQKLYFFATYYNANIQMNTHAFLSMHIKPDLTYKTILTEPETFADEVNQPISHILICNFAPHEQADIVSQKLTGQEWGISEFKTKAVRESFFKDGKAYQGTLVLANRNQISMIGFQYQYEAGVDCLDKYFFNGTLDKDYRINSKTEFVFSPRAIILSDKLTKTNQNQAQASVAQATSQTQAEKDASGNNQTKSMTVGPYTVKWEDYME